MQKNDQRVLHVPRFCVIYSTQMPFLLMLLIFSFFEQCRDKVMARVIYGDWDKVLVCPTWTGRCWPSATTFCIGEKNRDHHFTICVDAGLSTAWFAYKL